MASTGEKFPTASQTVLEAPWEDNTWVDAGSIFADDGNAASVTAASFDTNDQTYVLKGYTFDFSGIPAGATIDGVTCRVNTWYADGTVSMDLMQLLDTARAKGGTNQCAVPVALTVDNTTVITKGGAADLWGLALTRAWVQDSDFGVAMGFIATGDNADVFVDYVTLEIEYTAVHSGIAALAGTGTLTAIGTVVGGAVTGIAALAGTGTLSAVGSRIVRGIAALAGIGALSAVGTPTRHGIAALTGTGNLSAIGTVGGDILGVAALAGTGALSAVGTPTRHGIAALSGTGTLSAVGTPTRHGIAALAGIGNLSADGDVIALAVALLPGTGALSARGDTTDLGVALLTGTGNLTAAGFQTAFGVALLTGQGNLIAIGTTGNIVNGAALLEGFGALWVMATIRILNQYCRWESERWPVHVAGCVTRTRRKRS